MLAPVLNGLEHNSQSYLKQERQIEMNRNVNLLSRLNSRRLKETIRLFIGRGCYDIRQNQPRRDAGFSLIETLISMAIVFFLLIGTAQMLSYSLLLKQKADTHRIAADLVSRKLEILKSLRPDDALLTPGIHEEIVKDQNSDRHFLLNWEVDSSGEMLKKISLSVFKRPYAGKPELKVVFYISNSLKF